MIGSQDKLYRTSVKRQTLPTAEEVILSGTVQKAGNELL